MTHVKLYIAMLVIFLAVDAVWLSVMTPLVYTPALEHVLADEVNFWAAGIFYLLFVFAMLFLVVLPMRKEKRALKVVLYGAVLGMVCYATYDLTNLATIRDWPVLVTVIDIIWGTVLGGATAYGGFLIARWLRLS